MTRFRFAPVALLLVSLTSSALAAGRELAPRELAESAYRESFPVVGAAAGGRFLTVWREERLGFGTHIMGSLSDATGKRISPASFVVIPDANASAINVVGTGDGFTLFWNASLDETRMTDLDLSGRVIASRRVAVRQHFFRDVAWNGTHFLMTFRYLAAPGRFAGDAVLLTREGEVVHTIPLEGIRIANVEPFGATFFAAVAADTGLYGYRITADGAWTRMLLEPRRFGDHQPLRAVMIERGDGSLLVVWSGGEPGRSELLSVILSSSGEITRPRQIASRPADRALTPLTLMRSGDRFLLTFTDRATIGTMSIDSAGALLAETSVPVTPGTAATLAATNGTATAVVSEVQLLRSEVLQRSVDTTGRITEPEVHSIAFARQRQPILGAGGGRFLAAWEEQTETTRVRMAALDAFGEPQSDRFLDGSPHELPTPGELAWNGTEYLLAYFSLGNIRAVRLDANGRVLDREPLTLGSERTPQRLQIATAWAGNKWIVIWSTFARAHLATVSISGIVTPRGELKLGAPLPEGMQRTLGAIAVAGDEQRFLVAWVETQMPWCLTPICEVQRQEAWVMRFRHDGTVSAPAVAVMANATRVAMATSGDEYILITDSPSQSKATVIDDDFGMTFLASRTFSGGLSDVTWDGRDYVMAQRHRNEWPGYLVVTRFARNLELTAPPRGVLTLRADEFAPPSIAAVLSGDALVAISEGDAAHGSRAVVYAERDMELLPDWPPPRRRAVR